MYSKPQCVQCDSTERTFVKKNIKYTKVDISQDDAEYEKAMSYGHTSAPVVVVQYDDGTEKSWGGFRPEEISRLSVQ